MLNGLALTLSMVRIKGQSQTVSYILSGIIVTSVFTALTSLIKYVADPGDQLPAITFGLTPHRSNPATTIIKTPPSFVGNGFFTGKSSQNVQPVIYALPLESTLIPSAQSPPWPPRLVAKSRDEPSGLTLAIKRRKTPALQRYFQLVTT